METKHITPQYSSSIAVTRATVMNAELTALGHLSCQLEAGGRSYSAIADRDVASLSDLEQGAVVRAVLLRLPGSRDAAWSWLLLCCHLDPVLNTSSRPTLPITPNLEGTAP